MPMNFPKLFKDIDTQLQEFQWIQRRMIKTMLTCKHIIFENFSTSL